VISASKGVALAVAVAVAVVGKVVEADSVEVRRGSESCVECWQNLGYSVAAKALT
jgi:uncharacterized protein (UPF0212 family)